MAHGIIRPPLAGSLGGMPPGVQPVGRRDSHSPNPKSYIPPILREQTSGDDGLRARQRVGRQ